MEILKLSWNLMRLFQMFLVRIWEIHYQTFEIFTKNALTRSILPEIDWYYYHGAILAHTCIVEKTPTSWSVTSEPRVPTLHTLFIICKGWLKFCFPSPTVGLFVCVYLVLSMCVCVYLFVHLYVYSSFCMFSNAYISWK